MAERRPVVINDWQPARQTKQVFDKKQFKRSPQAAPYQSCRKSDPVIDSMKQPHIERLSNRALHEVRRYQKPCQYHNRNQRLITDCMHDSCFQSPAIKARRHYHG
uniref:Type III effector n=1 Tax=Panagrellus redivivus TaxID=6233 RepID=A0A7E4V4U7_PANRE